MGPFEEAFGIREFLLVPFPAGPAVDVPVHVHDENVQGHFAFPVFLDDFLDLVGGVGMEAGVPGAVSPAGEHRNLSAESGEFLKGVAVIFAVAEEEKVLVVFPYVGIEPFLLAVVHVHPALVQHEVAGFGDRSRRGGLGDVADILHFLGQFVVIPEHAPEVVSDGLIVDLVGVQPVVERAGDIEKRQFAVALVFPVAAGENFAVSDHGVVNVVHADDGAQVLGIKVAVAPFALHAAGFPLDLEAVFRQFRAVFVEDLEAGSPEGHAAFYELHFVEFLRLRHGKRSKCRAVVEFAFGIEFYSDHGVGQAGETGVAAAHASFGFFNCFAGIHKAGRYKKQGEITQKFKLHYLS